MLALDGATGVDECQRLFLGANSSPFVTCFSSVDPRPYFWHCVNDRNRPLQRQGASKRSCDAAESYRVMCATEGRPLPALDACLGGLLWGWGVGAHFSRNGKLGREIEVEKIDRGTVFIVRSVGKGMK